MFLLLPTVVHHRMASHRANSVAAPLAGHAAGRPHAGTSATAGSTSATISTRASRAATSVASGAAAASHDNNGTNAANNGPAAFITALLDILSHGDQKLAHWHKDGCSFIITDPDRCVIVAETIIS